jgi:hypothetical protein
MKRLKLEPELESEEIREGRPGGRVGPLLVSLLISHIILIIRRTASRSLDNLQLCFETIRFDP